MLYDNQFFFHTLQIKMGAQYIFHFVQIEFFFIII